MHVLWCNIHKQHIENLQETEGWSFLQCTMSSYNIKKYYFADYVEKQFKSTAADNDLRMWMLFRVVKHPNNIGEMKKFKNPNFSLCMK